MDFGWCTLMLSGTILQEAHMTMSDVANQINRVVKVQVRCRRGREGGRREGGRREGGREGRRVYLGPMTCRILSPL